MNITWQSILGAIAAIGTVIAWLERFYAKYEPIVKPIIEAAEAEYKKAMEDGVVTADERKQIVMAGVKSLEDQGKIKLNFITRWLLGRVIDRIAQSLPGLVFDAPVK